MSYNGNGRFGSGGHSFGGGSSSRGGSGPPTGLPTRGLFSGRGGSRGGGYGGSDGGAQGGFHGDQSGSASEKPPSGGFKSGGFNSNPSGSVGSGGFDQNQLFRERGGGYGGEQGPGGYGGGQQENKSGAASADYRGSRNDAGVFGSNDQGGGRGGYRGGRGGDGGPHSGGRDDFGSGGFSSNDYSRGGSNFRSSRGSGYGEGRGVGYYGGSSRGGGFDGGRGGGFDGGSSGGGGFDGGSRGRGGGGFNGGRGGYRNQSDNNFNSGGGFDSTSRGGGYDGGRGGFRGGGGGNFGDHDNFGNNDFSSGGGRGGDGGFRGGRGGGRGGGFRGNNDDFDSFGGRGGRFDSGGRGGGYSRGFGDDDSRGRGGFGNHGGYGREPMEFTPTGFGGNEGTNNDEERVERAPKGWMPEQTDLEAMYRNDLDNISKFEEDDQAEAKVFVEGGPDMSVNSWENAGLHEHLRDVLVKKCGFKKPRPIQAAAIPHCLVCRDVIAQAVTGSGKTLAFVLPILNQILKNPAANEEEKKRSPQAIVLEPTRELAMQVDGEFRKMANGTDIRTMLAFGQMDTWNLIRQLSDGIDVYVGTVGRLMGFIENGEISLHRLRYFVLDEADRLLNRADMQQLNTILNHREFKETEHQRQNMLFSATMPDACKQIATAFIKKDHVTIRNEGGTRANHRVTQIYVETANKLEKNKKLKEIFNADAEQNKTVKTLIFVETKKLTDFLAFEMSQMGITASSINGDRPQHTRTDLIQKFIRGDISVLIGTDVCARGLDVPNLERVINYDLPGTKMEGIEGGIDRFIHRIGRTGRTHKGTAITFVDPLRDHFFAKELIKICSAVGQTPPVFLKDCAEDTGTIGGGTTFGGGGFGTSAAGSGAFGTGSGGGFSSSGFGNNTSSGGFGSGGFGGEKKSDDASGGFGSSGFGTSGFGGEPAPEKKSDDTAFGSSGFGTSGFGNETGSGEETKKEEPPKTDDAPPSFGSSGFGPSADASTPAPEENKEKVEYSDW